MREYYHPKEGVYYKRNSFEGDYALMGAGAGGGIGTLSGYAYEKKVKNKIDGITAGLGLCSSIVGGLAGGYFMPRRILSWYNPPPVDAPLKYPRKIPPRVIPSHIGEKGLVGNWLFYRGSGNILKDYSGNGNNGDIKGAQWNDKGLAGWALSFDGTDDYVDVPDSPELNPTDAITVSMWIYPRDISNRHYVLVKTLRNWSGDEGYLIYIDNSQVRFNLSDTSTAVELRHSISANNWYHIVGVGSGAIGTKLFVNGTEVNSSADFYLAEYTGSLRFGRSHMAGYPHWFNGLIALARIYNRALSADEIKAQYDAEKAMFGV